MLQAREGKAGLQRGSAPCRAGGFTFIELIVVMVLLSVMAAYVALRWTSAGENTVAAQAELFARNVRHVQSLAMTQGLTLTLDVAAAQYSVRNGATVITDPATGNPFTVNLNDGVTVTLGTGTLHFDSLGRPRTTSTGAFDPTSALTANRVYRLAAGTTTWTITVSPLTGHALVTTP